MNPINANSELTNTANEPATTDSTDRFIATNLNTSSENINFSARNIVTSTEVKNHYVEEMSADEFNKKLESNTLPKHLVKVKGRLSYSNDSIQLPNIIQADLIHINKYNNKQKLPAEIIANWIDFIACDIDDIGIINTKTLSLHDMPQPTKISAGSIIKDWLFISNCPKLLNFPQNFAVKNLHIIDTKPTKLMSLNIKIVDGGEINVCYCKNIIFQEISKKLKHVNLHYSSHEVVNQLKDVAINEHCSIVGCFSFNTLPAGMKIGGNLELYYCYNFRNFPNDIIVVGEIIIFNCPQLHEIPEEWIQNLPERADGSSIRVTLNNTGISVEQTDRYNLLANGRAVFDNINPITRKIKLKSLEDVISFWHTESGNSQMPVIGILNSLQKQDVYLFLNKLTKSVSFKKNKKLACILAKQLMQILTMLADDNMELKERALAQISEANSSCVDRATLYLSKLQILQSIVAAEKVSRLNDVKGEQLRIAAVYYFYMEDIEDYAIAHAKRQGSSEDIEFFLDYLIRLAPRFNLPITTEYANYSAMANLKDTDIKQAERIIKEKVTNEFEQRLVKWNPWQQHLRFQQIKDKKYTDLPINPINKQQEYEYAIICETDFSDHVVYDQRIYSYNELIKCYVTNGTDPHTKLPIELAKIYKIEIHDK